MKGYLGLILELLVLSWRRAPLLTAGMFGILGLSVVAVPGTGLALRSAMDASVGDNARVAVLCALAAAAAYAVTATIVGIRQSLRVLLVEQVGVIDLNEQIHRDIAGIEEIDHLENPEFLDRVTVLRNAAWEIMAAAWSAVDACFAILQLVVSLVFLGALSPWLLILVAFAAGPLWFQRRGRVAVERAEVGSAESYRLQQQLFELATSAAEGKEIRTAGVGEELARRQAAAWDEALRQRTRARLVNAAWRLGGWLFFLSGFLTGLALVVHRARTGQGSVGDVMLTITVAANLQFAVQAAAAGSSGAAGATRLMQPLLWLRRYAARDRAGRMGTAEAPRRLSRGITIERLCFTYPTAGSPTVDDVSVHIPAGRVVALVGEYGSGKTTLVKLLAKLYRPDQGRILVDGVDLATVDAASWRSRLSGAFQDFGRFHVTFAEAVGIGDPQRMSDRAAVERAVRAADASGLVASLPHGLDTQLGRRFGGVDLSEGQWQKTALARASMRTAPLLFVLDEPTASLDAPSEHAVFERYMAQARAHAASTGAITLVVSHRFSTVTSADLILVLEGGRLVESGTHRELMVAHGRYAALYGIQQAAYSAAGAAPSG